MVVLTPTAGRFARKACRLTGRRASRLAARHAGLVPTTFCATVVLLAAAGGHAGSQGHGPAALQAGLRASVQADRVEAGTPGGLRRSGQPPTTPVRIVAERFDFWPSQIKVTHGTTLELSIESEDTLHGFRIVGTNVNVGVPKRGRGAVTVTFRPEKPGRYTFECSRMCGAGHNFMRGEIVVSEATP